MEDSESSEVKIFSRVETQYYHRIEQDKEWKRESQTVVNLNVATLNEK